MYKWNYWESSLRSKNRRSVWGKADKWETSSVLCAIPTLRTATHDHTTRALRRHRLRDTYEEENVNRIT